MKRSVFVSIAALALAGSSIDVAPASDGPDAATGPIYGVAIPAGYRDWRLVSVAHEAGTLNDIRAIMGNDPALLAFSEGRPAFPEGSIITRIAWTYVPSPENNRAFGREQSFVAGEPTPWYLQVMIKDSAKYASTGGWGFAQFDRNGHPADEAKHATCFACHLPAQDRDYVFTRYSP
jgi:hypothetical protein